jgi:hypothetical protein
MRLFDPAVRWIVPSMPILTDEAGARGPEDLHLEAAYLAEFDPSGDAPDVVRQIAGRAQRVGDLRAFALSDLGDRIDRHPLLRRADDTARMSALRFVERRLAEGRKIAAYGGEGSFSGFLRRVLSNLLLDWLRSPAARAELRRAEHDPSVAGDDDVEGPILPSEEIETRRRLAFAHLLASRAIESMAPGRGIPLRLALWPAYSHEENDLVAIAGFSHCHETSEGQADARGCDSGKRCTTPPAAWRASYDGELGQAKKEEPEGLSRRAIAVLTRIGHGKPMQKREGAVCERISKARIELVKELRRAGVKGSS